MVTKLTAHERALKLSYTLAESVETESQSISTVVHGIRVGGRLQCLHTASTSTHTHLFVHEKCGKDALESKA